MSSAPARVNPAARPAPPGIPKIPFAFRADPIALDGLRLTRTARAAFALVLDNARSRGWRCRLSNGTMGRILGCCSMTIKRALADLEAAGLILREFAAAGRIRTGIVVTWEGVEHSRSSDARTVEQACSTGGTSVFRGVEHSRSTNQSSPQSEEQTVPFLPPGKDPGEVPDGATAAAFLRSMIAKGKQQPTVVANLQPPAPKRTQPDAPPPSVTAPPAGPRLDDPRREVRVMVDQLAHGFTAGRTGPRRVSPKQLAAQLAEVRRRHGGRPPR